MSCLFSDAAATARRNQGRLPERCRKLQSEVANIGGCDALLDGDASATGCGALTQAADLCVSDACVYACNLPVPDAEWTACLDTASKACSDYVKADACNGLPRYAACHNANFHDYFMTLGELFCVSGPPYTGNFAGGASDDAGGAPLLKPLFNAWCVARLRAGRDRFSSASS